MPVGRPKSEIDTTVVAVRIPVALKKRLDRHINLKTSQGKGMKATINSVVGYLIQSFLDTQEDDQEQEKKSAKTRQEAQWPSKTKSLATPSVQPSVALRQKVASMKPNRRTVIELLKKYPDGLSPAETKKLVGAPKDLGDMMKNMANDGLLRRKKLGCYVVGDGVLDLLAEMKG